MIKSIGRHAALGAALALSAGLLVSSGCKRSNEPKPLPAPPVAAAPKAEPLPGARGELQNVAVLWRELQAEMGKDQLPFKTVAARAWSIAASVDQVMKLAERTTGSPAEPPKGADAGELNKLAFAVGMEGDRFAEAFHDVELIGINAKNLALAAGDFDAAETTKWWGQLDGLCRGVCGGMAPPAPAPAPAKAPAAAPADGKQ